MQSWDTSNIWKHICNALNTHKVKKANLYPDDILKWTCPPSMLSILGITRWEFETVKPKV